MDETYIKIKGTWNYLDRAKDKFGETIDIYLRKLRDTNSANAFFNRLFKKYGYLRHLVTDKANSIKFAFYRVDN